MKVLLLAADDGACGFYRIREPARVASELGVEVVVDNKIDVDAVTDSASKMTYVKQVKVDYDLIVIQRPLNQAFTSMIEQAKRQGIATAVELDDDFEQVHTQNIAHSAMFGDNTSNAKWVRAACEIADHVIVSTPALQRYALHGRSSVLRNRVPARFAEITPAYERNDRYEPKVGWTGSVQTHPDDLQVTKGAVAEVVSAHRAGFFTVGDGQLVQRNLRLSPETPFETTGWIDRELYYEMIPNISVGIVPLELSPFNEAKCIDAATKVLTKRGVIPAGLLSVFDHVWNDGDWRQVEAVSKEEPRTGMKFTTEDGYSISITPEHRMMVNGEWVEAKDIVIGDVMHMQPETVPDRPYVRMLWPSDSRMSKRAEYSGQEFYGKSDVPTIEITPRWGRFLGAFCGDGSISGKTAVTISCDGIDQDWIDLLADDLVEMGFYPGNVEKKMFDGTVLRRRDIRVASAHLVRVLESWGLAGRRDSGRPKRVVRVPDFIWNSPKDVIAAFISGYFEADGSLTSNGAAAVSKDRQILADMQRLLLLFGIESRLHSRVHSNQTGYSASFWHLTLRRAGLDVFHREIGFKSARKVAKSSAIVAKPHSNAYKPFTWRKKVVSIEEVDVTPVDIQVVGSVFAAAGFVSHNSALKGLELAALGVPFVASPTREYQRLEAYGVGQTARTPGEWSKKLNRWLSAPERRIAAAKEYRDTVLSEHTYETAGQEWADAWQKAIDYRKSSM